MKSRKSLKNEHNPESILSKAEKALAAGNLEKAIDLGEKALKLSPMAANRRKLARLYFMQVLSQMKSDDYAKAAKTISRAEKTLGDYLDLTFMKISAAFGSGDYAGVIQLIEKYETQYTQTDKIRDDGFAESYDQYSEILWLGSEAAGKLLDTDLSIKLMTKALEIAPEHHAHRVHLASFLAKMGKDEQALATIEEGIRRYPSVIALQNAKGMILAEMERLDEAESAIKEFIEKYPSDIDAVNNLGVVYDKMGLYEKAQAQFEKALEMDPNNQTARDNLAYLKNNIATEPQRISLCMIVKNEEKFLPGCLKTVKDLVDEIIVVDTGSTDRTMEIAREFGAIIYEHPWQNDFSYHRNQSIDYATGDWILILDADEELDPAEHDIIRSVVKRKDIDSVSFVVYNKIQSGRVGFLNSQRLFRNGKGFKYSGIVHNQLEISGKTLMSHLKVIHHGYGLSDEMMRKKAQRTEKLLLAQLEENPEAIFPHFNLAQIYRGMGEPAKSLEHAKIVVEKLGPNDLDRRHVYAMALDQMGCAYIGLERFDEAEEVFLKTLEFKEDYLDPMFNLGYMYMRQQRHDDAEAMFERYLVTKSRYSPHREWLGLILNNLHSEFAVYYGLGLISFIRGKYDQAIERLHRALDYTEDFEYLHHLLARCYREKGQHSKILEHCAKAIQHGHEDAEIRMIEGEAYLNLGRSAEAKKSFGRALELNPALNEAHLGMIGAASIDSNPREVLRQLDEFLENISPFSPQGIASRGDLLFEIGDYAGALRSYHDSNRIAPDDFKVVNNLGNCFAKSGNFASAEEYYRKAINLNPKFLASYRNLAVALIGQKKHQEALEYLDYYRNGNPNDADVHATMGDLYYAQKQYGTAIGCYEKYLQLQPNSLDAIVRLADCYFNQGKISAAAAGYRAVLKRNPEHGIANQRLSAIMEFSKPINGKKIESATV